MDRKEAERRVLRSGWLAAQTAEFQSLLLRRARLGAHAAGSAIIRLGDGPGGIYGVVAGGVGVHVPQPEGPVLLAHVGCSGLWFGHGPLLTRRPRTLEFSILEPSVLFHVPLPALDEIAAMGPAQARALHGVSEFSMDIAIATVATLQIHSAGRRIAATLLRVAPPADADEGPPGLLLTQSQLGEMANASRDLVNRSLAELQAKSWIAVQYRRITLLDLPALRAYVAGE